jgi:hypothetical protein
MKMTSAERDRAASHPSAPENIHPPGQFELSQKIAALTDLTAQQLREEWGLPESLHGAVQLSLTTINNRRDYRPFRARRRRRVISQMGAERVAEIVIGRRLFRWPFPKVRGFSGFGDRARNL